MERLKEKKKKSLSYGTGARQRKSNVCERQSEKRGEGGIIDISLCAEETNWWGE